MICSKCKRTVYRAFSYTDNNGVWHREECEDCYPMGKVNAAMTPTEKIRTRTLLPDGTVLSGKAGQRVVDAKRLAQAKGI